MMNQIVAIKDRAAERLAYVLGIQQNAAETPRPDLRPAPIASPDEPRKWPPRQPPGPNALAWCRAKIPGFESHERQVKESDAHRERLLREAGLPGADVAMAEGR